MVSCDIIRNFLGLQWLEVHILNYTSPSNFFRNSPENTYEAKTRQHRIVRLAEILANLYEVKGFSSVIRKLKTANLEATITELEIGMLLMANGLEFEFNEETSIFGQDYDLRISYKRHEFCAETKCKVEATKESVNTITNTLKHAAKQIKSDTPAIIFMRAPQNWHNIERFSDNFEDSVPNFTTFEEGVGRFFSGYRAYKGNKRVVSVISIFGMVFDEPGTILSMLLLRQFINPNHNFGEQLDLDLFKPIMEETVSWTSLIKTCLEDVN